MLCLFGNQRANYAAQNTLAGWHTQRHPGTNSWALVCIDVCGKLLKSNTAQCGPLGKFCSFTPIEQWSVVIVFSFGLEQVSNSLASRLAVQRYRSQSSPHSTTNNEKNRGLQSFHNPRRCTKRPSFHHYTKSVQYDNLSQNKHVSATIHSYSMLLFYKNLIESQAHLHIRGLSQQSLQASCLFPITSPPIPAKY